MRRSAQPPDPRDLPRLAGAQRRLRRDAAPARRRPPPDRDRRPSRRTRSRSRRGSRLHRITRTPHARRQLLPPPGGRRARRRPAGRRRAPRRHDRGRSRATASRSASSGTPRRCTPTCRCSRPWLGRLPVPNCASPHDTLGGVPALRLRGVVKRFGDADGRRPPRPRGPRRNLRRPARAQRRRQVDDDAPAHGAGDPGRGRDRDPRPPGARAQSKEARALCGVVPQLDNLDVTLTVEQNLRVFAHLYRVAARRAQGRGRARAAASRTSPTAATRRSTTSRGGMRRRLLIARGLVHQPRLILLDEPTVGLDPQVRQELWALIDRLRSEGASILMSTHYIEEAERLADTVTIMSHGKRRRHRLAARPDRRARRSRGGRGLRAAGQAAGGRARAPRPRASAPAGPARASPSCTPTATPRGRAPPDEPRGRLRPAHRGGDRVRLPPSGSAGSSAPP